MNSIHTSDLVEAATAAVFDRSVNLMKIAGSSREGRTATATIRFQVEIEKPSAQDPRSEPTAEGEELTYDIDTNTSEPDPSTPEPEARTSEPDASACAQDASRSEQDSDPTNTPRRKSTQQSSSLTSGIKKLRPNRLRYERMPPLQQVKPGGPGVDYPSITRRRPVLHASSASPNVKIDALLALFSSRLGDLLFNSVAQKPRNLRPFPSIRCFRLKTSGHLQDAQRAFQKAPPFPQFR